PATPGWVTRPARRTHPPAHPTWPGPAPVPLASGRSGIRSPDGRLVGEQVGDRRRDRQAQRVLQPAVFAERVALQEYPLPRRRHDEVEGPERQAERLQESHHPSPAPPRRPPPPIPAPALTAPQA